MEPSMDPNLLAEIYEGAWAQGQFCIYASVGLATASTVAVLLRLLARWRTVSKMGADDLCISISLIPLWCLVGVGVLMAQNGGMGVPDMFLTTSQEYVFKRTLFASVILYALAITTAKISVLFLYRRIFCSGCFRNAIYIVGGLCLLWFGIVFLVTMFQCSPVSLAWDYTIQGACINLQAMYYGFTISNMVLDVVINFMPVRMIWKLQLPLRQRIVLLFIMLVGIIAVAASVGRIGSVPDLALSDVSATILMPFLYTIIEPAFAIICACLPSYRPLFVIFSFKISCNRVSSGVRTWMGARGASSARSTANATTSTNISADYQDRKEWPLSNFSAPSSPTTPQPCTPRSLHLPIQLPDGQTPLQDWRTGQREIELV